MGVNLQMEDDTDRHAHYTDMALEGNQLTHWLPSIAATWWYRLIWLVKPLLLPSKSTSGDCSTWQLNDALTTLAQCGSTSLGCMHRE
jgi:hypothetical protein